jgi:hypothetical protein
VDFTKKRKEKKKKEWILRTSLGRNLRIQLTQDEAYNFQCMVLWLFSDIETESFFIVVMYIPR